ILEMNMPDDGCRFHRYLSLRNIRAGTRSAELTLTPWKKALPHPLDCRAEPRQIRLPRETVIAILDEGEAHRIGGQMFGEHHRVRPGDIFVAHALQNMDRAVGADRAAQKQMVPALLDQRLCNRIGLWRIGRSAQPHPFLKQFLARGVRHLCKDQRLGEVDGGGNQDKALEPLRFKAFVQYPRGQHREPAAHRRSNEDLRALGQGANGGKAFFEPRTDGSRFETAFRRAMPGIVETQIGAARLRRVTVEMFRLDPVHVRFEAAKPDDRWARRSRFLGSAQIGDVPGGRSASHQERVRTNSVLHTANLRFVPVHRYARLMNIKKSRVYSSRSRLSNAGLSADASF